MSADLQCASCLLCQDGEYERRLKMANVIDLECDAGWANRYAIWNCLDSYDHLRKRIPEPTFNYMGLPIELRFNILEVLIGPAIWPREKVECRRCYTGDNSSEPCEALRDFHAYQTSIDNEVVEYDSEDDEIPELMSLQEIEQSDGCIHVEPPENEPPGLASLAIQTAGWPKTVGIDVPCEVTKSTYGCSKPHRFGNNVFSTDGLSRKNAHWMRSLLLVSRQFSSEVQKMIWESTVKRYNRLHHMGASIPLLQSIASSTSFNTLSRVSLSMSNSQLFRFVGYRSSRERAFTPCTSSREVTLDILTNLKLDHLHFDFQIPKLTPRLGGHPSINDPWRHVHGGSSTIASCQRKFVDLFFILAYDRLRSVPKVTFSGYIKESNIDTWGVILAGSRKIHPRDMASKIPTIMSTHVDKFPPRCDCRARCHHSRRVQVLGYTDGMGCVFEGSPPQDILG